MKKIIFIFTALPLLSFADIYSCDELLNDMHNSCGGSNSCIDTLNEYFEIISDLVYIVNQNGLLIINYQNQ